METYTQEQISRIMPVLAQIAAIPPDVLFDSNAKDRSITRPRALIAKFLVEQLNISREETANSMRMSYAWVLYSLRNAADYLKTDSRLQDIFLQMKAAIRKMDLDLPPTYSVEQIASAIEAMASEAGIEGKDLCKRLNRRSNVATIRAMVSKFLVEQLGITYERASSFLGMSPAYSYNTIQRLNADLETDRELQYLYASLLDAGHEALEEPVAKAA